MRHTPSVQGDLGYRVADLGEDSLIIIGFLRAVQDSVVRISRQYAVLSEITDGLAPALKRRALIPTGYQHKLFRDNLLAF